MSADHFCGPITLPRGLRNDRTSALIGASLGVATLDAMACSSSDNSASNESGDLTNDGEILANPRQGISSAQALSVLGIAPPCTGRENLVGEKEAAVRKKSPKEGTSVENEKSNRNLPQQKGEGIAEERTGYPIGRRHGEALLEVQAEHQRPCSARSCGEEKTVALKASGDNSAQYEDLFTYSDGEDDNLEEKRHSTAEPASWPDTTDASTAAASALSNGLVGARDSSRGSKYEGKMDDYARAATAALTDPGQGRRCQRHRQSIAERESNVGESEMDQQRQQTPVVVEGVTTTSRHDEDLGDKNGMSRVEGKYTEDGEAPDAGSRSNMSKEGQKISGEEGIIVNVDIARHVSGFSSPKKNGGAFDRLGETASSDPRRALSLSVTSSMETTPLKGEFILATAYAAATTAETKITTEKPVIPAAGAEGGYAEGQYNDENMTNGAAGIALSMAESSRSLDSMPERRDRALSTDDSEPRKQWSAVANWEQKKKTAIIGTASITGKTVEELEEELRWIRGALKSRVQVHFHMLLVNGHHHGSALPFS